MYYPTLNMINFTVTVPQTLNYTPADLIRRFANSSPRYTTLTDRFFSLHLVDLYSGKRYDYHHLDRKKTEDGQEAVTIYMEVI